jgi:hypothetical protein
MLNWISSAIGGVVIKTQNLLVSLILARPKRYLMDNKKNCYALSRSETPSILYTMSPQSPKRRKLDHEYDEAASASENGGGSSEESDDSASESAHDATTINQKRPRPSQTQHTDESALYSGGLYKSSMFKLQVDQMLSEVRPNYEKRLGGVDQALHKLNSLIDGIEGQDFLPVR